MQRGKSTPGAKTESTSLKIVVVESNQAQIEFEIERNIKKIRTLINKLRPAERQKYFNGLLSHILDEPVEPANHPASKKINSDKDYSALSYEELILIEELSIKMEQLYRTMDHDPS
jgi:hypothetical protein